jgi:hypothetical protein
LTRVSFFSLFMTVEVGIQRTVTNYNSVFKKMIAFLIS